MLNGETGSSSYEFHFSFDSYISLYLRVMKTEKGEERKILLTDVHTVLSMLLAS